ncbi:ketopantoate reductase family protein [Desulfitobacterium sp.]|uniref:ketopantoate reductase family protein n=1 Tax=Desulfitobacterium sp. TaxID=49981 RepID=UPI002B9EA600|nr:ketopantoate reductase family protein [Desulfitobacterium sp.]HVJ49029.1 ketopantoate reductase family protein [Desulfitobacterium sp.]
MNIIVIGAGAVGGYFGGKMAQAGMTVTFLVREKRYQQLKERGLRVESVHGDFIVQPHCVLKAEEVENPDLVILSVKNYQLEGTFPDLKNFVDRGAKILPLMNGVQHIDQLVSAFGLEHIIGGLCYIESTLNEFGDILQKSSIHDIVFGPLTEMNSTFFQELEALFLKSGVNVKLSTEILTELWTKYIFLVTLSGMTTATRNPIGISLKDPVTFAFIKDFVEELVNLAKTLKVKLPEGFTEQMIQRIKNTAPEMTSSMHRDFEKGHPLELDSLQGAVLNMAEQQKVATPCTRAIYALLHPFK